MTTVRTPVIASVSEAISSYAKIPAMQLLFSALTSLFFATTPALPVKPPLVIAHRGACGYLPEHTLAAYELAIEQGADFIEPDLVSTRDGVLIVRHENEISHTTDVKTKFPHRQKTKTIDGQTVAGWFTEDFTLAEIKTLRATERLPFRNQANNGKYPIPTFEDVLQLVQRHNQAKQRRIGIYPETKHPSYFDAAGLSLEEPLLKLLKQYGYTQASDPIFIQSFETSNLKELHRLTPVKLVQLIEDTGQPYDVQKSHQSLSYSQMITPKGLTEIATYAQGIGPYKRLIVPENPDKTLAKPTTLIQDAHRVGLLVHPWTFRSDPSFLAPTYQGKAEAEYQQFYQLGVDGVFSEFPDTALKAR